MSCLCAVVAVSAAIVPVQAQMKSALLDAVPDDVYLVVNGRHNAERDFLNAYWDEVWAALCQSGLQKDFMELIGIAAGQEQVDQMGQMTAAYGAMFEAIDWSTIAHEQVVFAMRMPEVVSKGGNMNIGGPDMVLMLGGAPGSGESNFNAISTIVDAVGAQVGAMAGEGAIRVEKSERLGASVVTLGPAPDIQRANYGLGVARTGDTIVITLGDKMLPDVLGLMSGKGGKKPISQKSRFRTAFETLPPAEDELVFFDMHQLTAGIQSIFDAVSGAAALQGGGGSIDRSHATEEGNALDRQAIAAVRAGNMEEAIDLENKALAAAPQDCRLMYNMACIQSLAGNKDEALDWLSKSVDAGFAKPADMQHDDDLAAVRDDARFEDIVARAQAKANEAGPSQRSADLQVAMAVFGEVIGMMNTIDYVAEVSYTDGHSVHVDTVAAVPPAARDTAFFKVCNSGKNLTSFEKFIPAEAQSFRVGGGVDALALYAYIEDFVRSFGPTGEGILAQWESMQEQFGLNVRDDVLAWMGGPTASITLENGEWVQMMEVKDAEAATARVSSAIKFAESQLQQLATQNPMMGMIGLSTAPVLHEKLEGFQAITMAMIPKPMVWGVREGQLMFGSSADAVALCLATAEGKHPNVKSNERIMSELVKPDGTFQTIAYTDLRNMGNEIAEACAGLGMAGSMMVMMAPPEAQKPLTKALQMVAKLGTVARKIDFYKSQTSVTTMDDIGWRTKGVTHYQSPSERAKPASTETASSEPAAAQ